MEARTAIDRFWAKVDVSGECWEWRGATTGQGYGIFLDHGTHRVVAHRWLYEQIHGPLGDRFACHHCDNRRCVRPDHIFPGSIHENNRDCLEKGRRPHGEGASSAKLTDEQVRDIRRRYDAGGWTGDLANEYGVAAITITAIVRGHSWKHLDPDRLIPTRRHRIPHHSGEDSPRAVLTDAQICEILALYEGDGRVLKRGQGRSGHAVGMSQGALARRFNVGQSTISRIVRHEGRAADPRFSRAT